MTECCTASLTSHSRPEKAGLLLVVVVRSTGSGEEVEGVDMRRREIEKGGGELDSLGGASLLIIINSLTCK